MGLISCCVRFIIITPLLFEYVYTTNVLSCFTALFRYRDRLELCMLNVLTTCTALFLYLYGWNICMLLMCLSRFTALFLHHYCLNICIPSRSGSRFTRLFLHHDWFLLYLILHVTCYRGHCIILASCRSWIYVYLKFYRFRCILPTPLQTRLSIGMLLMPAWLRRLYALGSQHDGWRLGKLGYGLSRFTALLLLHDCLSIWVFD